MVSSNIPSHLRLLRAACALVLLGTAAKASAQATAWTNGNTNFFWDDPLNWSSGVPVAGEDVFFSGTAPGIIDLNGNAIASGSPFANLRFDAGGYTIADSLGTDNLTFGNLLQSTGNNTISARVTSSGTGTVISGGTLRLTNTSLTAANNFTGATLMVSGGATLDAAFGSARPVTAGASGSSSIAGATVALNGGTLLLSGQRYDTGTGGLTAQIYAQQINRNARNEFASLGGLMALVNTSTAETLTAPNAGFTNAIGTVDFNNTAYGSNAPFASLGQSGLDNLFATWKGKFVSAGGTYTWSGNSDDGLIVFVDGQLVLNRNNFQGPAGTATASSTFTLSAGAHDIIVGYYEGNGGAGVQLFKDTSGTVFSLADFIAAQPQTILGNNVDLNATSTIAADNTYGVTLGTLRANTAVTTLTIGRSIAGQPSSDGLVRFGATNFNTNGTFTFETLSDLALGTLNDGTSTVTIRKTGSGNLILDGTTGTLDTSGTSIDVQAGRLVVARSSTTINPLGNAAVQLNGVGSVLQLNLAEALTGNATFDNAVQINENALIEATNHSTTTREAILGSATRGVSIASGKTLSLLANNTANLRISGQISGGGDVVVSAGSDAGSQMAITIFNAVNSFTGKTTIENGGYARLDVSGALDSSRYIDIFGIGRLEFNAANTFNANTPRIIWRAGSSLRLNNTAAVGGGTLAVGTGRILELTQSSYTGSGTVIHGPGSYIAISGNVLPFPSTTTLVGLRASDFRSLDIIRANASLTGAGDGVVSQGWGATPAGTILQIQNGNRVIANSAIQELNGQIITIDGAARTIDHGVRLDVGTLGGVIAASAGFTLTVNEFLNQDANSGQLVIGTELALDNRFSTGTVLLGGTNTFFSTSKAVEILGGATLATTAAVGGTTGFGTAAAPNLGVNLSRGTLQLTQPATGGTTGRTGVVGKVNVTGQGRLNVNRVTAGLVTEMQIASPLSRSNRGTLGLLATGNSLGTDEQITFVNLADAPQRLVATGGGTINAVAPWILNVSGSTASFVDYDPAQDAITGPGFVNAAYTTMTTAANLSAGTATTIADVTAAITVSGTNIVGLLRTNNNLTGGTINIDRGGLIISATTARTITTNLVAASGVELNVYSIGQSHVLNGTLTSDAGLTKWGANNLVLGADNSATLVGDIAINEGVLDIATTPGDKALGAASNKIVFNGGTLKTNALALTRDVVVNAGGGNFQTNGAVTLTINSSITGTGALTKSATSNNNGILVLGAANTFTGGLFINNGLVRFSADNQLGAAPAAGQYAQGHITINDGSSTTNATLELAAGSGNVTSSRQFTFLGTNGSGPKISVAGATDTLTLNGDIRGSGAFTKLGSGTLVFAAPLGNGYQGNTVVSAGTLLVNNTSLTGTGTGTVTVNSAAKLGGSGIIEGSINGNTGSTIAPGGATDAGASGILRGQGGLTLANDANFQWSLAIETVTGPGLGSFDRLVIDNGAVNITSGANFTFDFAAGVGPQADAFWSVNHTWDDVIQITGLATAGTLGTFDLNNTAWSSFGSFSLTSDANGYDLTWTAVPEPSSLGLLAAAGLGLFVRRRRSKQA